MLEICLYLGGIIVCVAVISLITCGIVGSIYEYDNNDKRRFMKKVLLIGIVLIFIGECGINAVTRKEYTETRLTNRYELKLFKNGTKVEEKILEEDVYVVGFVNSRKTYIYYRLKDGKRYKKDIGSGNVFVSEIANLKKPVMKEYTTCKKYKGCSTSFVRFLTDFQINETHKFEILVPEGTIQLNIDY